MKETANLGYAAFLILKNYKLIEPATICDKKFSLKFDIDETTDRQLFKEYTNSDHSKFDAIIVNLKKSLPRY